MRRAFELAGLAADRGTDPHLRALARLMVAAQQGEIAVFDQWWQSWFDGPLPSSPPHDHLVMPGMLPADQLQALRQSSQDHFDSLFVELMTLYHSGAIAMADEAIDEAGDPRLKLMSQAIRHQKHGRIELMHGSEGISAVRAAVSAMFGAEPASGLGQDGGGAH